MKDLDDKNPWAALRQKKDYDYANIPATRRDIKDLERRLLTRLTYRISALILAALAVCILAVFIK